MKGHFMQKKEISDNMEEQTEILNKLHNRHLARCLSRLNEINTAQIIIDAVKKEFSYYTTEIKDQVLTSNFYNHDKSNTNNN